MKKTVYLYGVINSGEKKKFNSEKESNARGVYTIPHQNIACVVRNYPGSSFDYRIREKVAKELVSHQIIIERIMKEHTIIPAKFGTLLENIDAGKKVLEASYSEFENRLKEIEQKIELDVVANWDDLNSVIKKIGEEYEEIRKFREEIAQMPPQDTFQERIKLGSMINDALGVKKNELQHEILEFIKNRVRIIDSRKHELMTDKMILNCAFLLRKEDENVLDQALKELNEKYNEQIDFRCVGPLPPYSFFTYTVQKTNFEDIDKARKLLELGDKADSSLIKSAYRKLVQEKHPDKTPDDREAQEKFEEIQAAYRTLLEYCKDERKSLRKEDVEGTYMIGVFDTGNEN